MWSNKYIGIPYLDNGRDTAGTDCWGLVRLIYKEELDIELPSFYTDYKISDTDRIAELINQYREGWEQLSLPEEKCVVVFRILGKVSHIGIMIDEHQFIHNRRNQATSVESINSVKWKNRCVGFYRYSEAATTGFENKPSPLKLTEITIEFNEGFTIGEAFEAIYINQEIPENLKSRVVVFVDGTQVNKETDGSTILVTGQKLEYRLIPDGGGDDLFRTLLTIAVVVVAVQTGMWMADAGAFGGASMFGITTASGAATAGMFTQVGVVMVGMALVNAIAPIRPLDFNSPASPDSSNPQLLMTGARNDARQYESIPVVLGTYRYVPPVAATNFLSVENDISFLRMLLCWGYDDLAIEEPTIKVGATLLSSYLDKDTQKKHGYITEANVNTDPALALYGKDTTQIVPNIELPFTEPSGNATDTIYQVIPESVTSISVSIHFPQGLRGIYKTGGSAGQVFPVSFKFKLRARKLNPNTLLPIDPSPSGWIKPASAFPAQTVTFPHGLAKSVINDNYYYGYTYSLVKGYTTTIVYLNSYGAIAKVSGIPGSLPNSTTGIIEGITTKTRWGRDTQYGPPTYTYGPTLPTVPSGGKPLYIVQTWCDGTPGYFGAPPTNITYGIQSFVDVRVANGITGGTGSYYNNGTSYAIDLTSGGTSSTPDEFQYGLTDQSYYLRKDAFTDTVTFSLDHTSPGPYEVSIQRTSSAELEYPDSYQYKKASLFLITGFNSASTAVLPPKNVGLTLTSLKIQATDQLNGSIEGINALVSSRCLDYVSGSWVRRATNNPASLFRYVLQHPANVQAIKDSEVSSRIDLANLEDWHAYCVTNSLTYNSVILQKRSLLEVLRDICAAGMASPILSNGKWGVIIDRPRITLVQHFTPHNSWGFEGSRLLSNPPHALRVNIISAYRNYDSKELTVYSYTSKVMSVTTTAGSNTATISSTLPLHPTLSVYNIKSDDKRITITSSTSVPINTKVVSITNNTTIVLSSNATATGTTNVTFNVPYYPETAELFESISLPGVTDEVQAEKLAKFHLAQVMLRPETYSLNTDMEHLVCNRGDLVRVTHDVPMWGLSTGRIKNIITDTQLELSESIPLEAGTQYTIRIRTSTGASVIRNLVIVGAPAYYSTINLTASVSVLEGEPNNLFMLGTVNSESNEMIVVGIEPSSNLTAKLNLVDYSPAVYTSSDKFSALPSFDTNITSPIAFFNKYISSTPTIVTSSIRSDESVMELSGSSYIYKISIPYTNPANLDKTVTHVQYRMCLTSDVSRSWRIEGKVELGAGSVLLSDVIEGQNYTIQLRYSSGSGFTGPWTADATHTIIGKTTQPSQITGTPLAIPQGNTLRISWNKSPEIDVVRYEVRNTDTNWGLDNLFLYSGAATSCIVTPAALGILKTYYVRAVDSARLYSATSATTTYTVTRPSAPINITSIFASTSATASSYTITWGNSSPAFGLLSYRIRVTLPNSSFTDTIVNTPSHVITASWIGTAVINVFTKDSLGNESLSSTPYNLIKLAPNNVTVPITITPVGPKLLLDWAEVAKTSLPIVAYEVRTSNTNWGDGTTFTWKGSVSECQVTPGVVGTPVNYYVKAIDSDNIYSVSASPSAYTRATPPTISAINTPVYSTTTTGQSNVTFSWARPSGETFSITAYRLTLTKPGPIIVTADINSTSWTVNADWEGTATLTVRAIDILQEVSTSVFIQDITKTPPSIASVIVATPTPVDNTLVLSWTAATPGSLPVSLYEIRAADEDTVLYRGNSLNYAVQGNNISQGLNTYYLYAIDTAGKYSLTSKQINYTYDILSGITTVVNYPVFTSNGTALFKWNPPAIGSFGVAEYSVALTSSAPTLSSIRNTTDWEVPVAWSNSTATLTITPKDVLGNTGAPTLITLTNNLPNTPTIPIETLKGTNLELDWTDNTISTATQLPIGWYEIRNYTNSTVIWKGSSSWASISLVGTIPANNTWYIWAYDSNGKPCVTPRAHTYTNLVNPDPVPSVVYSFGTNISDSILTLSWNAQTPRFGLKHYRISYTNSSSLQVGFTVTTTAALNTINITPIPKSDSSNTVWTGSKNFSVVVVDQLGNESAATIQSITKSPPGPVTNYTAQVVDNNVLLSWVLPVRTTLPVDTTRTKKAPIPSLGNIQDDWTYGTNIGDKTGTFTTVFERAAGKYTYLIAAVDTDNVEGPPTAISATVSQPPDYIFNGQLISQFNGTATGNVSGADVSLTTTVVKTNAQTDASGVVLPVDIASNWSLHYTANSWTTPQNQIDAGFPIYIQPSVSSGSYSETFDFGQTFSSTKVTANILGIAVSGTVNVVTTIDVSPDGVTWLSTPYVGTSYFATNFRYVKIELTVTQSDGNHGLYRVSYLDASLDSKALNDSGVIVTGAQTNGTTVNFNVPFIDVTSVTLTPNGTTPLMAIYDYKDTVILGTYNIISNVCTITTAQPHGFVTNGDAIGQKVRLAFGSGGAVPFTGVYAITGVSSTTVYTVAVVTTSTSGSVSTYSESMKVYVFNNLGVRQSGIPVTWAARGY